VNVVDMMRAGVAYGGVNLICVCTKVWWKAVDEYAQNQAIIHEIGHKIGMVPDGLGKGPDKPATWYDNTKGHVGDHCFHGLSPNLVRYDGDIDDSKIRCVMYGAATKRSEFCSNCAPLVCKLDLNNGFEPL
jgi:hypothetical protein